MKKLSLQKYTILISIAFISLACNFPHLVSPGNEIMDGLIQDRQVSISRDSVEKYMLSPLQQELLSQYGYPDRFTITFTTITLSSGELIGLRQENWYYDSAGYEIIFRNGEKFTEQGSNPVTAQGLGSTAYHPEDFVQDMNLIEVLAVTGEDSYYSERIQDELVEKGQLVFLKGLSTVFEDGELRYIETLPLGNAGQP